MQVKWRDISEKILEEGQTVEQEGRAWKNEHFLIFKAYGKDYYVLEMFGMYLTFDTDEEAKDYVQALFELPLTIRNASETLERIEDEMTRRR